MDKLKQLTPNDFDCEHIFDASPDPICIIDSEHNLIRANQAFIKRVGSIK